MSSLVSSRIDLWLTCSRFSVGGIKEISHAVEKVRLSVQISPILDSTVSFVIDVESFIFEVKT